MDFVQPPVMYYMWAAVDPDELDQDGRDQLAAMDQAKLADARALLAWECEMRKAAKAAGISPTFYMLEAAADYNKQPSGLAEQTGATVEKQAISKSTTQ